MLELRYDDKTKEITAWCADLGQFGNLERDGHTVVILDIPIPSIPSDALLYDEISKQLVSNPTYVEPLPPRDLRAEIDELKARLNRAGVA